jgi:tRNA pseudouridine38-40 synthase
LSKMGSEVRTLKMVLQYEGTGFHGFQRQGDKRTVQSEVESALASVFGHVVRVAGAGRTDAGVHALGQVISTTCSGTIPTAQIAAAANSLLPDDVAVVRVDEVCGGFHAQKSAQGKVYRYLIHNSRIKSPFASRFSYLVEQELDAEGMAIAASHFLGEHDFTCMRAAGSTVKTSTRIVREARVWVDDWFGRTVFFQVEANGFLYNMVRIMAGTLLSVGRGKVSPEDIPGILASKDRKRAGQTLPPHGLWLVLVKY